MIDRRRFVLAAAALAAASHGRAQSSPRTWRVGFLSARRRPPSLDADYYGAFPRRMRELGYVEGGNLAIEWRFADGDYDRLAGMAAELATTKVDAMLALGAPGAIAAQKATATIPIVFVVSADPVKAGLVRSLARPGGNLTGISNLSADLTPKQLELLRAAVPRLARVAILVNPANAVHADIVASLERSAKAAGLASFPLQAQTPPELERAIDAAKRGGAGALIVALDPFLIQQQADIARASMRVGLPTIFSNSEAADAGGLVTYGQNQSEIYARAAGYVDRILRGARPADLPVEQPTKIELVVNLRTARALGLVPPASLLSAADRLIE
jgi:putative ABC transport system substrate-binding protein